MTNPRITYNLPKKIDRWVNITLGKHTGFRFSKMHVCQQLSSGLFSSIRLLSYLYRFLLAFLWCELILEWATTPYHSLGLIWVTQTAGVLSRKLKFMCHSNKLEVSGDLHCSVRLKVKQSSNFAQLRLKGSWRRNLKAWIQLFHTENSADQLTPQELCLKIRHYFLPLKI